MAPMSMSLTLVHPNSLFVEIESAIEVGCIKLVPADGARRRGRGAFRCGHGWVGREDHNGSVLRIGQDGETEHSRNIGGGLP